MAEDKKYKLDLFKTLESIDRGNKTYYQNLTEEEKKGYAALVLMRYMSSLPSQNSQADLSVILTNDIVNVGFWELSNHPELQHQLMCVVGTGVKQHRPWISKKKTTNTPNLDEFFSKIYPDVNITELNILKTDLTTDALETLCRAHGESKADTKKILEDLKKLDA